MLAQRLELAAERQGGHRGRLRTRRQPELPAAAEELAREVTLLGTYDEACE